jgi:hypothetical protein
MMLMLILICYERKTMSFRKNGTADKFEQKGRSVNKTFRE